MENAYNNFNITTIFRHPLRLTERPRNNFNNANTVRHPLQPRSEQAATQNFCASRAPRKNGAANRSILVSASIVAFRSIAARDTRTALPSAHTPAFVVRPATRPRASSNGRTPVRWLEQHGLAWPAANNLCPHERTPRPVAINAAKPRSVPSKAATPMLDRPPQQQPPADRRARRREQQRRHRQERRRVRWHKPRSPKNYCGEVRRP